MHARSDRRPPSSVMVTPDYQSVLASLYALEAAKGMDFKLERVALALKNLGDPHRRYPTVHIAGTNGKGSVAAMLHAILSAAGYRVGLYTSPHLISFNERLRVGAACVGEDEVVVLAQRVRSAATVRGIELTFFEFVTVMAFLYFAEKSVDCAVIEVGLGGRLDATNVIDPDVAVITTIGLDHEEFLGETTEAIAREKAGIIKPGKPVVIGRVVGAARAVLQEVASEKGATAYWFGEHFEAAGDEPWAFSGLGQILDPLAIGLRGRHQRDNAAAAVATAICLRERFAISAAAIRDGLAAVRWPGRLDVVATAPLVVLDGAHNTDGVDALVRELPGIVHGRKVHLLFGVMRDKRWQAMVEMLGRCVASAALTNPLPSRGEAVEALAQSFAKHCPVSVAPHPTRAMEELLASVDPREAILVTGSLYLVGAVLPLFAGGQQDRRLRDRAAASL